nr:MAG TPA_asm: hypothetical protein [Caudoviricetes sp.]
MYSQAIVYQVFIDKPSINFLQQNLGQSLPLVKLEDWLLVQTMLSRD